MAADRDCFSISKCIILIICLLASISSTSLLVWKFFLSSNINAEVNLYEQCSLKFCSNNTFAEMLMYGCFNTNPSSRTTVTGTNTNPSSPITATDTNTNPSSPITATDTNTNPSSPITVTGTNTNPSSPITVTGTNTNPSSPTTANNTDITSMTTTTPQKNLDRLPKDLTPISYDILIIPYIGNNSAWNATQIFTFEGNIKMEFKCENPTDKIIFHSANLNLNTSGINAQSPDDNEFGILSVLIDDKKELVTMVMKKMCIRSANYVLKFSFTGTIQDELLGFHRGSYVITPSGTRSYYATTNFMPTHARRAFPCFDEPSFRAKFKLTIRRHKSFSTSLFNTQIERSVQVGDWFMDYFKETANLPTYLIAYSIGNFKQSIVTSTQGNKCEMTARPQAIDANQLRFALNQLVLIIDFYEKFFATLYPFDKITYLCVPNLIADSIDNAAFVFGKESSFLYINSTDSILNERQILGLISQSLTRQWFGNLVSPSWWNHFWFYEGFVLWARHLGTQAYNVNLRSLEYFYVQQLDLLVKDSLETSKPITVSSGVEVVSNLFEDLDSYKKTANIFRMLSATLTEKVFKKGLENFLRRYRFSNPEPSNLWQELTIQAHIDGTLNETLTVAQVVDTWTLQRGYPLVTINRMSLSRINVTQTWFLLNPLNSILNTSEYAGAKWFIPLTITSKEESNFNLEKRPNWMLPKDPTEVIFDLQGIIVSDQSWILANIQHSGFYRVNYDLNNWNLLIQQLNTNHLSIRPVNRAQLLDDSFNLGRAEVIDQMMFLEMCKYLTKESDPLPFVAAFAGLDSIRLYIQDDFDIIRKYQAYYTSILIPTYNRTKWTLNLNDEQTSLQIQTLSVMCYFGYNDCVTQARTLYTGWANSNRALPINFKTIIYSTIARHGTENDWNFMYGFAINRTSYNERIRILNSLASTNSSSLIISLYKKLSDLNVILPADRPSLLDSIASNVNGRKLAFDFLEENWRELYAGYQKEPQTLKYIIHVCTRHLNSNADIKRLQEFISTTSNLGIFVNDLNYAVENIKMNIRWLERNQQKLYSWLNNF